MIYRMEGFSECCLNQDLQDGRIFRMLSESGFTGWKNFQNEKYDFKIPTNFRITDMKYSVNFKILKILIQTMWQLFGEQTDEIINELNEVLAA